MSEVVIVDTGPVAGAVETAMVAAHTDAAVLVLSPGDQRPDAERAVEHLQHVGARVAGIVFNRATTRDLQKSSSVRSSSPSPRHAG